MDLDRKSLEAAVSGGIVSAPQADALWRFLSERHRETASFRPSHILYYLGGLVATGALTLFMTLGWERFGATGLLLIALVYCAVAIAITEALSRRGLKIVAGCTAVLAIATVPLAMYALQHLLGFWPEDKQGIAGYRDYHYRIDWRWLLMELATLAAGAVALWRYRFPFLVLPVAVTLWYMSMDLTPFLFGGDSFFSDQGKLVSIGFGLGMIAFALVVDARSRDTADFAFWLYVFGVLTFWGGLSSLNSESEIRKLGYCTLNVALIAVGAALSRRVFAVFGGLGVAFYLGHLSHTVFKDSMLFPIALTAIGLAIVGCGIVWQRNEQRWGRHLRRWLPAPLREAVERRTDH